MKKETKVVVVVIQSFQAVFSGGFNGYDPVEKPIATILAVASVAIAGFAALVGLKRFLETPIAAQPNITPALGRYFDDIEKELSGSSDPNIRTELLTWIAAHPNIISISGVRFRLVMRMLFKISDPSIRKEFLDWIALNPEATSQFGEIFAYFAISSLSLSDSKIEEMAKFLVSNTRLWSKCHPETLRRLQRIKECFPENTGNGVINAIYQNTVDLPQLPDGIVLDNLRNILQGDPSLKASMHRFLISRLEQETDRLGATRLAQFLWDHREYLLITENDEVLRHILISLDRPTRKGDPYGIFALLKAGAKEQISDFSLPPKDVSSHILNTTKMLETCQTSFTAVEIPTAIKSMNKEKLNEMIDALLARYESLDDAGQAQFMDSLPSYVIASIGQGSLRSLLQNLQSSYLNQLLGDSSEEEIPLDKAYFLSLIYSIHDQSNECVDGEFVSRQERALLIAAASIHGCPAGQQEGLRKAYNGLEAKYRVKGCMQAGELGVDQAKEVMTQFTQKVVEELITFDTPMMRELTGTDPDRIEIAQLSHQSIYVKNLIAHAIGLSHRVQFDLHTGVISDRLFGRSRENVLEIFHKHFMARFKESLRNIMNTEPSTTEKETLRRALSALGNTVGITELDLFTIDEETGTKYTVNMEAALELLSRIGNLLPNQNLEEPPLTQ